MTLYSSLFRRASRAALCLVLMLLPAANRAFAQPRPVRQKAEKQVTISIPQLMLDANDTAARKQKLEGYTSDGAFVPHGQVSLKHANTRAALLGLYRDGMAEGAWRMYYPSGQLQSEMIYRAGKPVGVARRYWPDGKLAREEEYAGGKLRMWRVYDKRGVRQHEFRKQNYQVVYAYYTTAKGAIIANARLASLEFKGSPLKFVKACRMRDDGTHRCKTPYQIWRDLNTFLEPEVVMAVLDSLNSKYVEEALDEANKTLTQCGGGWVATRVSDTGALAQPQSEFRARMTQGEVSNMTNACREAQVSGITGGSSSGGDANYQSQVSKTKESMNAMIEACRARQDAGPGGGVASGGTSQPSGGTSADTTPPPAGGQAGESDEEDFTDDGWGEWQEDTQTTGGKKTETRTKRNDPTHKETRDATTKDPISKEWKQGDVTYRETYPEENIVVLTETVDGQVTRETTNGIVDKTALRVVKDYTTNTLTRYTLVGQPEAWYKTSSGPIDPKKPYNPGMPPGPGCDECTAGDCEAMAASWHRFTSMCDQSGWQTYECSSFIRTLMGCVDSAEIRPGPDGDMTCANQNSDTAAARSFECNKRKMLQSFPGPGSPDPCSGGPTGIEAPSLVVDACNDPTAQCRPDRLVDVGLMRDGTRTQGGVMRPTGIN